MTVNFYWKSAAPAVNRSRDSVSSKTQPVIQKLLSDNFQSIEYI